MKINQSMFFPFLSFFSISIICFSRFLTARIRILFSLSSSLLHMRFGIRTRISNLIFKKVLIFLTFLPYPDPDSSTRIRIRIRIKKDHWTGIQTKNGCRSTTSIRILFFSLHCFFLGMGILIWNRTESQISTRKNGKK